MKPTLLFAAFALPALAATASGMAALTGAQIVLSLLVVRRMPC